MLVCSSCGSPLDDRAVGGQCPRCLVSLGLDLDAPAGAAPPPPPTRLAGEGAVEPPVSSETVAPGARLGGYHVLALLGRGGMGEVYRARDSRLGREVALKLLPPELGARPDMLARFEREARVLASLNHPNIATLYGFETDGDRRFLVMELLEGETLAERLDRGPLPEHEALAIFVEVARGLAAAHERGVVHRDLKPSNIELERSGRVKVLDFGLAKPAVTAHGASASHSISPTLPLDETKAGMLLGTAAYMSPEQARGREVDRRTDVWSFGCCLYEAITGAQPFDGDSVAEILANVLKEDPDLELLAAVASPRVVRLVERCLVDDPARRLRDLGDIALELEDAMGGPRAAPSQSGAGAVRPTSAAAAMPRARRASAAGVARGARPPTPAAWIAAAVIAGIVIGLVAWRLTTSRSAEPPRPLRRFAVSVGEAAGGVHSLALSHDGRLLAVAPNATGAPLLLGRLDRAGWEPIAGTESGEFPFFSPDGRWLAFFTSRENHLKKVPVEGGSPVVLAQGLTRNWGGSWSEDGSIVFNAESGGGGLQRIAENGGAVEVLTKPDRAAGEDSHRWPQVLPGGKLVLFTIWMGGGKSPQLALLDLRDRSVRPLVPGLYGRSLAGGHLVYFDGRQGMTAPFDARAGKLLGPARPIEGFAESGPWGHRAVAFTDDGLMVRAVSSLRRPVWVDRSGNRQEIESMPPASYQTPALSHAGERLAIAVAGEGESSDIWIYDLASGRRSRLTNGGENTSPVWIDGDRAIVFWSDKDGARRLYRRPVDGSSEAQPLVAAPHGRPVTTTPDGRFVATNHNFDAWLVPVDGQGEPKPLLSTAFVEGNVSFSPDGVWFAYVSDESGPFEVYVRRFDGTGGRQVVSRSHGSTDDVIWSKAGDQILFRASGVMFSVPVRETPGGEVAIGEPVELWKDPYLLTTGLDMDLAADGRLLMLAEVEPAKLVFFEHWTEGVVAAAEAEPVPAP